MIQSIKSFCNSSKPFFSYLIICAVILSSIYLPTTLTQFQRHDDFMFEVYDEVEDCRGSLEYASLVGYGRVLHGEIIRCHYLPLYRQHKGPEFFVLNRLFTLIILIVTCAMFSYWISRVCQKDKFVSIALATLIFTLPGFQFFAAQGVVATNIGALLMVMFALYFLTDWNIQGSWKKDLLNYKKVFLCLGILLVSSFVYTTHLLFFAVPTAVVLIFTNREKWKKDRVLIVRHLIVIGLALGLYWVIQELVVVPVFKHFYPEATFGVEGDYGRASLTTKINQVFQNLAASFYIIKGLNLWIISTVDYIAKPVMVYLGITLLVFIGKEGFEAFRAKEIKPRVLFLGQIAVALAAIYCVVQSPQILVDRISYYRVLVHYSAIIVLLLVWSSFFWMKLVAKDTSQKILCGMLIFFAFVTGAYAQYNTLRFYANLSVSETDFLESKLRPLLEKKASSAFIVRPIGNYRIGGDEHGMFTSTFDNDYGVRGMVRAIYQRNNQNPDILKIQTTNKPYIVQVMDQQALRAGVQERIIINMNELFTLYVKHH